MLALIAGLPGLIALAVCIRHGTERAFLWVYLPTLLLLPDDYRWPILGHLTFHEAAVIPIAVCFLLSSSRTWKLSVTDALLLGYCALTVVSQFYNRNFYDARNTALRDATYIMFPYILAKGLLNREDFGLKVAKQIAVLLAIVSIASVYEFKMTANLFETLVQPFFPPSYWTPSFRYGVTRVAGPFGHALSAGIILLVGYRLTRWIEWSRCWHRQIPLLDISAVRFCEFSITAGAAMTAARGAWTGAIIASLLVFLGRSSNRIWTLTATMALILVVGLPVYWGVHDYVSPKPGQEISESEETASYRLELVSEYLPIIEERSGLGYGQGQAWGQDPFPVMNGMWSIDDHYVLV